VPLKKENYGADDAVDNRNLKEFSTEQRISVLEARAQHGVWEWLK
jgi:hypothetical protein